jgi:hypothetical protein
VFYPGKKTRTQASLFIAVADAYLTSAETMLNINYRVGEEDADFKDYGVVQFVLNKKIPEFE